MRYTVAQTSLVRNLANKALHCPYYFYFTDNVEGLTETNMAIQGNFSDKKPKALRTVGGSRRPNNDQRGRSNLTPQEITLIYKAIRAKSRNPDQLETLALCAYHHVFRIGRNKMAAY